MIVANQRSNRVDQVKVSVSSGALTSTGASIELPSPVCVVVR